MGHVPVQSQGPVQVQGDVKNVCDSKRVEKFFSEIEGKLSTEMEWDWDLTKPRTASSSSCTKDVESLFEPESKVVGSQHLVTRSQPAAGMAAGSGSDEGVPEPVGRAAAQTPVTRAKVESYRPAARSRATCEAQGLGSSSTLSSQQLNSQKQNAKRATLKAAEKVTKVGGTPACGVAKEGRLLDSVAAFWERKKAKFEAAD